MPLDHGSYVEKSRFAEALTITSQIFLDGRNVSIENFASSARACIDDRLLRVPEIKIQPKYRSIDGRGNNKDHPEWGSADTPFARFGSKNYDDGIYAIKKSVVDGSDLPNPREIVREILLKAVRASEPQVKLNHMAILVVLFATHDIHYQVPKSPACSNNEIQCCTKNRRRKLPPHLIDSDCLPIEVQTTDPFYGSKNIGCLNMVRSKLSRYSDGIETGEILNRATSYLDLSLIYGNRDSELHPIRLYSDGKLRMSKNNVLPVDVYGKFLPSMDRFISSPIATIWPALFTRNHNHLAERLAKLNAHWSDETVFQEARRINIANFQFNLITAKSIERVFNSPVNESYSKSRKVATTLEFAFTYRGGHYYVPSELLLEKENGTITGILQSDTMGKFDSIVEPNFDDALRAAINHPINFAEYSDEIVNRINKDESGAGIDLISIDIQRGRDHGIPSFLEIRRLCNLKPVVQTFEDFKLIFNATNVELLKKLYKSPDDVDFYVAGLLEAFETVGNPLTGRTFGCIVGENYRNVMGGDIYFFSHPENPYPFSPSQLEAIKAYSMTNLYCANSNLKTVNRIFSFVPSPFNQKVECTNLPVMDLTAWKE